MNDMQVVPPAPSFEERAAPRRLLNGTVIALLVLAAIAAQAVRGDFAGLHPLWWLGIGLFLFLAASRLFTWRPTRVALYDAFLAVERGRRSWKIRLSEVETTEVRPWFLSLRPWNRGAYYHPSGQSGGPVRGNLLWWHGGSLSRPRPAVILTFRDGRSPIILPVERADDLATALSVAIRSLPPREIEYKATIEPGVVGRHIRLKNAFFLSGFAQAFLFLPFSGVPWRWAFPLIILHGVAAIGNLILGTRSSPPGRVALLFVKISWAVIILCWTIVLIADSVSAGA